MKRQAPMTQRAMAIQPLFESFSLKNMSAKIPEYGDCVAWMIAGKVITESVTYGT